MEDIFEIVTVANKEKSGETGVRLAIRMKIGGHETPLPVLGACNSYEELEADVEAIRANLDRVMIRAKEVFQESPFPGGLQLSSDMRPEEIWSILSGTEDEDHFAEGFNGLDDSKRREVAEYVLTQCNIFSGKASVFSSRYSNESGLLE